MSRGPQPVLISHDAWGRVKGGVVIAEQLGRSMTPQRRRGGWVPTPPPVRGRVTASAVVSGTGPNTVWKYSFAESEQSAPGPGNLSDKPNGRTGTLNAENDREEVNPTATGSTVATGGGFFPDDLDPDGDSTDEFTIGPVAVGQPALFYPVLCTDGTLIYRFDAPNTFTGGCT